MSILSEESRFHPTFLPPFNSWNVCQPPEDDTPATCAIVRELSMDQGDQDDLSFWRPGTSPATTSEEQVDRDDLNLFLTGSGLVAAPERPQACTLFCYGG